MILRYDIVAQTFFFVKRDFGIEFMVEFCL